MLSANLKKLRDSQKLTQADVADRIGVARTTYAMYEQGKREPDIDTINKIASYYKVTTDYLLGRSDSPTPSSIDKDEEAFQAFSNDPSLQKWYKDLPKSKEEDLRLLRDMWETINRNK
ncbi:helix-turn-helix domain-containing protein [Viridibacillus arvi]|uniref:helix-turn-helix domain-containing protein n=1 Tax=Viridibacillus arvi TaxID=263475 RepID=UPI003D29F0BB